MSKKLPEIYDSVVLGVLAYEFPFSDKANAEEKIRGQLKRKKLGPYDSERINLLRRLKDELQEEIYRGEKSRHFIRRHDKYCDMRDFDVLQLTSEMIGHYPQIPKKEIENFVPFCVFNYYLR